MSEFWKRVAFTGVAVIVIIGITQKLLVPEETRTGLVWSDTLADLGVLASNQNFHTEFYFKNNNSYALQIIPEACCGMQASIQPELVSSGGGGTVRIQGQAPNNPTNINTREHRSVWVHVKGHPDLRRELQIQYKMPATIHPIPTNIWINEAKEGMTISKSLFVYKDEGIADCSGVQVHDPSVSVKQMRKSSVDRQDFQVNVALPPKSHEYFTSLVTVESSDANAPRIDIPIHIVVQSCVTIQPQSLHMGQFAVNQDRLISCTLTTLKPLLKVIIKRSPQWLKAKVIRITKQKVEVRGQVHGSHAGGLEGEIALQVITDHEFEALVSISGYVDGH